jgi:hypothetical protein
MAYGDDHKRHEHPAFGMVAFHRIQGGSSKLFGSHLETHSTYIRLVVKRAELHHDTTRDWFFGRKSLVEVDLSPAQFSELLTTMNIGDGVPCTIRRLNNELVEPIPEDEFKTEQDRIVESFSEEITEKNKLVRVNKRKIRELLDKKGTFRKKDREEVWTLIEEVMRHFEVNTTYTLQSFMEATSRVVTEAKAQADHFVTHALTKLGMGKLRERLAAQEALPAASIDLRAAAQLMGLSDDEVHEMYEDLEHELEGTTRAERLSYVSEPEEAPSSDRLDDRAARAVDDVIAKQDQDYAERVYPQRVGMSKQKTIKNGTGDGVIIIDEE